MNILSIETSCDETGVAIIKAHGSLETRDVSFLVRGNALYSQAAKHAPYGGVYPNLAKREHSENLIPLLTEALRGAELLHPQTPSPIVEQSQLEDILTREPALYEQLCVFLEKHTRPDIDAIAVTVGPGLEPALWVGINLARALSLAWNMPVVAVNHMEGHILTSLLQETEKDTYTMKSLTLPALALLISGGHTEFVLMQEWLSYKKVGQTRDDAVGEAFDKTARLLGLPYPGGPEISRLAAQARAEGIADQIKLPRPMLDSDDLDMSFSGLKTAVRRIVEEKGEITEHDRLAIARAFEDAVADVFVHKTRAALTTHGVSDLIVGGGVAANTYITAELESLLTREFPRATLHVCKPIHATDNALMIAIAGYLRAHAEHYTDPTTLHAQGNLFLT